MTKICVKCGIENLDPLLSFMEGQYTTWTGIPSSGKSEIIDEVMAKLTMAHGWKWGIASFENQPAAIHATKIMENWVVVRLLSEKTQHTD